MTDFDELLDVVMTMRRDLDAHVIKTENMFRVGPVIDRDHEKGVRVEHGTEGEPDGSPWVQPNDRSGAERKLPLKGEQVMVLAPYGSPEQGIMLPYGHSDAKPNPAKDADETVHHNRDGQRHAVKDGHVRNQADKKMSVGAGDGGKEGEGKGGGGSNLRHELNAQLQGLRADLTQARNEIAGLHEAASKMRQIAEGRIPELKTIKDILDGDPASLEKAAKAALGNLDGYMAKAFQGAIGKLANGFMGQIAGLVRGAMSGQLAGLLGEVSALALDHGLEGVVGAALDEAHALVEDVAAGAVDQLAAPLDAIEAAFAGGPGAAAYALLRGRFGDALGMVSDVAANLGGLLDGQSNLVKGMTKSMRLGGYEGGD